jgi:polysaccharide biosynthesis transport protein
MTDEIHQEQEFDLRAMLQILLNRKWLILGFAAVLTLAVGVGTYFQPKVYEAKVTLLVGREGPRLLTADPVPQDRFGQRDYLKTQAAILTSRTLLQGAVKRLMQDGFYGAVAPDHIEARSMDLAKRLQYRTRVVTADDSQVITLFVEGGIPDRVAMIANAVADEYVDSNQESKVAMANQAVAWLTSKLVEQKTKLSEAEDDLRTFKQKENIVAPDEDDPFSTLNLTRLNDEYLTTRFQRIERETRLAAMKKSRQSQKDGGKASSVGSLDAEIQRKVRDSLAADYVQAQLDLRNLSERYGPEHPDIITLKGKVAKIQKELENLEQPVEAPAPKVVVTDDQIADLQAEVSALTQKEKALAQALDANKQRTQNLSKTAVGYSLRKQAVDLNRATYSDLLTRLNEAELSSQIKTTTLKVLDRAEAPRAPIEPKPVRNLIVAVLLGLVLGMGLALLRENLDRRIKSPEEAARLLRLPLLAVVPGVVPNKRVDKKKQEEEGKDRPITLRHPRSHYAECYRNLRTSILFSAGRAAPRSILVTSAVAGEGKSTTAANLAVVLTQSGRKVLLIDADLRRPSLQRCFANVGKRGIVEALRGACRPEEAVEHSSLEHLDLLLCHAIPGNPSELLGSKEMLAMIEHFKQQYDVVVIDSPVIISVPDAIILAARVESVVLVHRPGSAERDMVRHAREKLDEVKANVLGLVMNNVNLEKSGYQYSHYLYYGYGAEGGQETGSDQAGERS